MMPGHGMMVRFGSVNHVKMVNTVTYRVAMLLRMKHTEHLVNNEIMMPQDLNLLLMAD